MNKSSIEETGYLNNLKHVLKIMRITLFLLFFCILFSSASNSYSQKITIKSGTTSIKRVCEEIEKNSEYIFVFSDNCEKLLDKKVNVDANSKNVTELLNALFSNTNLTYTILDKQIVVYESKENNPVKEVERIVSENTIQQPDRKQITGHIVDVKGLNVIGASIVEVGTTNGTVSDVNGYFSLNVKNDATLRIRHIGCIEQNINTSDGIIFNIVLNEDTQALSEIVVVGYSSQKKETLTGAIATIKNEDLLTSTNANISNILVGRVPGISSTQASGEAGQNAAKLKIRGVATFNSSGQDPLIVIDGIQSSAEIFNALDPNEIDNISILKDASSTAVYGVKGANGVIIVTTKRGKSGSPKINVTYRYGLSRLASILKTVNSYDYAVFRNEAINNDKISGNYQFLFTEDELWKFKNNKDFTPEEVEAMPIPNEDKQLLKNSPALYYRSNNPVKDVFGGIAPQSQFNINFTGGENKFDYFVSLGHFAEEGVLNNSTYEGMDVNSKYNRYNVRSNIDVKVNKRMKILLDFGGQLHESDGTLASEGTSMYFRYRELWNGIFGNPPYSGPGILDGKLVSGYSQETNPLANKGANGYSPVGVMLSRNMLKKRTSNMNITGKLEFDLDFIIKGLSLSGTISYNDTYSKGTMYNKEVPTYKVTRNPENQSEILFFGGTTGPYSVSDNLYNNKWNRLYLESKLFYSNTFDKHAVTGLLLYNVQTTKYPSLQYNVPQNLIGTASRITYAYDNRYFGEFNMGYNGSENFPEGKRFGFFPSFSAGWIISEEDFFPENVFISWLKTRFSYGFVGNDQIGGDRFLYLPNSWRSGGYWVLGGYPFGNTNGSYADPHYSGYMEDEVGNPHVTWEKAQKSNLGIDIYMFDNRLTFTGDYFQEKRNNILWNRGTIPGIVAADLAPANIGKVSNKGYELAIGWKDQLSHFLYGITFNLSYAKNKILFMDEPSHPYEWMNTTGFSIGQYKGYQMEGFYNNEEEASNRPYIEFDGNKVAPGDVRYIDINGDGKINAQDQTPLGYPNLPLYSFSSNIVFGYKGLSMNILLNGSRGGSILMNSLYISNPFYTVHGNALQYQFDGRWTPEKVEQGITPTFPKASIRTIDSQNGVVNDIWLNSTQFIRLKNIELAYTFTNLGRLKNIKLSSIKIYANGMNLFTWGAKLIDGYDPEQAASAESTEGFLYPPTKSCNFGINFQF